VTAGTASLKQVAADWLSLYGERRDQALLELAKFLVSASGSRVVVTADMLELEPEELVGRAAELELLPAGPCPAAAPGPGGRPFRGNFTELLRQVVDKAGGAILCDGVLMDRVASLATSLSSCTARALRYTGCLDALALVGGLAGVERREVEHRRTTTRQLEAERKKAPGRRDAARLEVLETKLGEVTENITELDHMIGFLMQSVFVLRVKDSAAEIRNLCLEHFGTWVADYPARFLEDTNLNYVGWSLR
jgi:hypothetical protein